MFWCAAVPMRKLRLIISGPQWQRNETGTGLVYKVTSFLGFLSLFLLLLLLLASFCFPQPRDYACGSSWQCRRSFAIASLSCLALPCLATTWACVGCCVGCFAVLYLLLLHHVAFKVRFELFRCVRTCHPHQSPRHGIDPNDDACLPCGLHPFGFPCRRFSATPMRQQRGPFRPKVEQHHDSRFTANVNIATHCCAGFSLLHPS